MTDEELPVTKNMEEMPSSRDSKQSEHQFMSSIGMFSIGLAAGFIAIIAYIASFYLGSGSVWVSSIAPTIGVIIGLWLGFHNKTWSYLLGFVVSPAFAYGVLYLLATLIGETMKGSGSI